MEKADEKSWGTLPMPEQVEELEYSARFTPEEFERISYGRIPFDMDDKWFIYLEENRLYLHRSWTGFCIYRVEFKRDETGIFVSRAVCNRDPMQYSWWEVAEDALRLKHLINTLLLGKKEPFPKLSRDSPRVYKFPSPEEYEKVQRAREETAKRIAKQNEEIKKMLEEVAKARK